MEEHPSQLADSKRTTNTELVIPQVKREFIWPAQTHSTGLILRATKLLLWISIWWAIHSSVLMEEVTDIFSIRVRDGVEALPKALSKTLQSPILHKLPLSPRKGPSTLSAPTATSSFMRTAPITCSLISRMLAP